MADVDAPTRPTSYDEVDWTRVTDVTVACFLPDADLVLLPSGRGHALPSGPVRAGEDVLVDTVLRVPLEQAGFRRQGTHVVAASDDGRHVGFWVDGARYTGRTSGPSTHWWVGRADDAAALLRADDHPGLARMVELAEESRRRLTDTEFFADCQRLLEAAYLSATTEQGGSGFGGTAAEWRLARSVLCDAVDGDVSFLDVGCANGLLMESIVAWCAERGHVVEPYGVDISPALVDVARQRLPHWRDRIWAGNALYWRPPEEHRFDVVHALPDLVPEHRQADLIRHLLDTAVTPGGRLLVSQYGVADQDRQAPAVLERLGYPVDGVTAVPARGRADDAPSAWTVKPWD